MSAFSHLKNREARVAKLQELLKQFHTAVKGINAYWAKKGHTLHLAREIKRFEWDVQEPMDKLWSEMSTDERKAFL